MAALIISFIIIGAISGALFGGFLAVCRSIRRTDKRRGNLRPETPMPCRHHMLAYASRWDDDNTPALV